ncbi:uncharacterized protein TNCV_1150641 [Trichonephila clavipes]|nr:uncharacterized protein TNCV_1150641 [Trichonephila clavipes]
MKHRKGFRDWFTIDTLPKKMRKNENGIINLDIITGDGTHWVCYYNDPKYEFIEYFDPFGEYMSDDYELPEEIEKYLKTSNKHIRYSSNFLQKPSSVKCGYYCMKYIIERNKDSKTSEKSEDFKIEFRNPIPIKNATIALKSASIWVSWHNINKTYNNHTLTYKIGTETHHITFDDGNYTVRDLNNTIRNILKKGEIQFGINFATSRIVLKLEPGYLVDFSQGELHKILGFEQRIYNQPEETARYLANISRGIDDIHIHCDIIHGTLYSDRTSDVLYSFTPSNPPGSLNKIDEINPLFVDVNRSDYIHSIRMYITDQDDNIINLNTHRVIYMLILSPINEL